MTESLHKIVAEQGLVLAFALVGVLMWLSAVICRRPEGFTPARSRLSRRWLWPGSAAC
jgi:hypothetical protein